MNKLIPVVILALIGLLVASSAIYFLKETEYAIVVRLGKVVRADLEPGLKIKAPLIDTAIRFDRRVQTLDEKPAQYLTIEKKNVIVDSFATWRIKDPELFYTRTSGGNLRVADQLLGKIIKEGLRNEFAERTVQEVIARERELISGELVRTVEEKIQNFGIELVDVRVKAINLPPEVSSSVFARMEAERKRIARDFRAKGQESAERIRAEADRQRTVLLAEAERDAQVMRGEGDSEAAEIYAKAYGSNKEFYTLYRSLTAYENVFQSGQDFILLRPDSEFFQYFKKLE